MCRYGRKSIIGARTLPSVTVTVQDLLGGRCLILAVLCQTTTKCPSSHYTVYFLCTQPVKRLLQLRFDFDSTRQSGHHDSMLMKAWIHTRRYFTSEVGKRAIPTSTIEGCYSMLIRQRECHSYYRVIGYTLLGVVHILYNALEGGGWSAIYALHNGGGCFCSCYISLCICVWYLGRPFLLLFFTGQQMLQFAMGII